MSNFVLLIPANCAIFCKFPVCFYISLLVKMILFVNISKGITLPQNCHLLLPALDCWVGILQWKLGAFKFAVIYSKYFTPNHRLCVCWPVQCEKVRKLPFQKKKMKREMQYFAPVLASLCPDIGFDWVYDCSLLKL